MLHKIAQSMSCTSEAKLGRWERKHASVSQLWTLPQLQWLRLIPPWWICKPIWWFPYTHMLHTHRVLHAGRTGHLPHRKHQWKKPVWAPKTPALLLLKAFHHTMKKFTVETKTLVLTLYYLAHDITVVALSHSEPHHNVAFTCTRHSMGQRQGAEQFGGAWPRNRSHGKPVRAASKASP